MRHLSRLRYSGTLPPYDQIKFETVKKKTSLKVKNVYEKPNLTVDIAYLCIKEEQLHILTTKRDTTPFKGKNALVGGYIHCDEDKDLIATTKRLISNKAKLPYDYIEQIETIASKTRDPRGWSATILFMALVSDSHLSDNDVIMQNGQWLPLDSPERNSLAFDHSLLIDKVRERLVAKSRYTSIPLYLLPKEFTLSHAQRYFEITTQSKLEKKSFRRRLLDSGIIEDTGNQAQAGKRKAALYRLKPNLNPHYFPRMIG